MASNTKSFVFAVVLRDSMAITPAILNLNLARDPEKKCVRVGRLSGLKHSGQIFRKCRYRKKLSILRGSTAEYESDGIRSKLEVGLSLERALINRLRGEGWTVVNPPPKLNSSVYIIELDPIVRQHRDVRRNNPRSKASLPCLYVGQTKRTPEERFTEHNTGEGLKKGGRHLKGRCIKLRKDLYEFYNSMPLLESLILERDLADELRQQGHTILGGH